MGGEDPYEERLAKMQRATEAMTAAMVDVDTKITQAHQAQADLNQTIKDAKAAMRDCADEEARRALRRRLSQIVEGLKT